MRIEFEIKNQWETAEQFIDHCKERAIDEDYNCSAEVMILSENKLVFETYWSQFTYLVNLNQFGREYEYIKVIYNGARKGFLRQNLMFSCKDLNILKFYSIVGEGSKLEHYDNIAVPVISILKNKFFEMNFKESTVNNLVSQLNFDEIMKFLNLENIYINGWINTHCTALEYHGLALPKTVEIVNAYNEKLAPEKDRNKKVELFSELKRTLKEANHD